VTRINYQIRRGRVTRINYQIRRVVDTEILAKSGEVFSENEGDALLEEIKALFDKRQKSIKHTLLHISLAKLEIAHIQHVCWIVQEKQVWFVEQGTGEYKTIKVFHQSLCFSDRKPRPTKINEARLLALSDSISSNFTYTSFFSLSPSISSFNGRFLLSAVFHLESVLFIQ